MSEQEYPSLIRKHWPKYLPETLAGSPPTPSSGGAAQCATFQNHFLRWAEE
jgi:hypothetical protein